MYVYVCVYSYVYIHLHPHHTHSSYCLDTFPPTFKSWLNNSQPWLPHSLGIRLELVCLAWRQLILTCLVPLHLPRPGHKYCRWTWQVISCNAEQIPGVPGKLVDWLLPESTLVSVSTLHLPPPCMSMWCGSVRGYVHTCLALLTCMELWFVCTYEMLKCCTEVVKYCCSWLCNYLR